MIPNLTTSDDIRQAIDEGPRIRTKRNVTAGREAGGMQREPAR